MNFDFTETEIDVETILIVQPTIPPQPAGPSLDRFEREVDPAGIALPHERARRAEHADKTHFQRRALRSSQAPAARAARRTAQQDGGGHDAA
jgi:tRNA U34 5-carboxymethylaminomethyl modifying enzyme MnmG/GidA